MKPEQRETAASSKDSFNIPDKLNANEKR